MEEGRVTFVCRLWLMEGWLYRLGDEEMRDKGRDWHFGGEGRAKSDLAAIELLN
jgi:hypothetical protein